MTEARAISNKLDTGKDEYVFKIIITTEPYTDRQPIFDVMNKAVPLVGMVPADQEDVYLGTKLVEFEEYEVILLAHIVTKGNQPIWLTQGVLEVVDYTEGHDIELDLYFTAERLLNKQLQYRNSFN